MRLPWWLIIVIILVILWFMGFRIPGTGGSQA